MEGIAKISLLKMQNDEFKSIVTVALDGNDYEARFVSADKFPVYSRLKNIQEFIIDALNHGWKITLMEVE